MLKSDIHYISFTPSAHPYYRQRLGGLVILSNGAMRCVLLKPTLSGTFNPLLIGECAVGMVFF